MWTKKTYTNIWSFHKLKLKTERGSESKIYCTADRKLRIVIMTLVLNLVRGENNSF